MPITKNIGDDAHKKNKEYFSRKRNDKKNLKPLKVTRNFRIEISTFGLGIIFFSFYSFSKDTNFSQNRRLYFKKQVE